MNINKNLILIKNEDKTRSIEFCKYNSDTKKYDVTFNGGKIYSYNFNNLEWFSNPEIIDVENKVIYAKGKPLILVNKAIGFENHIRVIYKNDYSQVYSKRDISMEESCLKNPEANNCFQYLKDLSQSIGLMLDGSKTLLGKQYEKITHISPKSALSFYLKPDHIVQNKSEDNINFPFGFNLSQKEATEKAFKNSVSVIEGPPGTGKTQTILNIIANAVMMDKSVAVVSNNNSATDNVYEKLKKYDLDFFAATLGSRSNKESFIKNQSGTYADMSNWKLEEEEKHRGLEELNKSKDSIINMLEKQNKIARLEHELSEMEIEKKHFEKEYLSNNVANLKYNTIRKLKADKIMRFLVELKINSSIVENITFGIKIKNLFRYGIYNFKFYNNSMDVVIDYLYSLYYENKVKEITLELNRLKAQLDRFNFEEEMKAYNDKSLKLFKAALQKKYLRNVRAIFTEKDLWIKFDEFIKEYPVVLSTTHSLRNCISENFLFDYLIIDEASQVDLLTGALSLSCAKNVVVVGDLKQLTNVVSNEDKEVSKKIFDLYNLDEAYNFSSNNLLSSITKLNKDVKKTLLKEHYRCHPKIINFCNKEFYNNELIILTKESEDDKPLSLYKTNAGNHARGTINQRQIDIIKDEILPTIGGEKSIGVISPYRLQADEVLNAVGIDSGIEADTVHKFQGREKDIVILSTVSNDINDFIDNANLINVAISRAVDKLVVVTTDFEEGNSNIGDLIKYVQYNNFEVVESKVSSIFDLLYKSYEDKLMDALKRTKKISEFNSENLMFELIRDVLKNSEFSNLDVAVHIPLKMIIRDASILSNEERKFALNPWTHTDFLIFNKLNKMPVLAVEVDGYKFHVQNEEQLQRDRKKDGILAKYEVPVIRFPTNGSGEGEKLKEKLRDIYS
ncbi:MAG: AAA domain-containing protein [Clostridium sp.]|uniref:AAA domain-containing protein n=1 Tax=Clostridium sp. TaxID=1506 RepID=UPI003024259C